MKRAVLPFVVLGAVLGACKEEKPKAHDVEARPTATGPASVVSAPNAVVTAKSEPSFHGGDAARGKELISKFECNRCHAVENHEPAAKEKHCVQCHDDISKGKFPAPADALARWKKTTDPYTATPSLLNLGARFERDWLHSFLLGPEDLRPHLDQSMPRLELTEKDAADLVAYLTASVPAAAALPSGTAEKGRGIIDQKSCATCHEFSGVPAFSVKPDPHVTDEIQKRGIRLAPDLRFTRERFHPSAIVAWLRDPKALKHDTLMPAHGLNDEEAADVAAYLYETELAPIEPKPSPERLPVLERRVGFEEVMDEVFGVTCRHCHSDPDASLGDGGPGNTGGFGFTPKGLDLATYRGVAAGYLDEEKERQSVFLPLKDGTPRLLAVLLARQKEAAGGRHDEVRGMPLGLPALTPEQVQLVESWIAQGRPR